MNGSADLSVRLKPGTSSAQLSGGQQTQCAGNDVECAVCPSALRPCNASEPEEHGLAVREQEKEKSCQTETGTNTNINTLLHEQSAIKKDKQSFCCSSYS